MYTVLNVIGPKARELLAQLTDTSLRVADFPHMSGKVCMHHNVRFRQCDEV